MLNLFYIFKSTPKKSKYRILIIAPSSRVKGGISSVIKNLLHSTLNRNFYFHIVDTNVDGSYLLKCAAAYIGFLKTIYLFIFYKIDIVHIHIGDFPSIIRKSLFVLISKIFNTKCLLHFHGALFISQYFNSNSLYKAIAKKVFFYSDLTICLSYSWKNKLKEIFPNVPVKVVYNGVKISFPHNQYLNRVIKNKVHLTFIGKIGDRKGVFNLIKAFNNLILKGYKLHLYIAGDGEVIKLKKILKENNLNHCISYVGWLKEKERNSLLLNTDILILPSKGEGMPMALLEGMNFGIPIIATRVGGIPEIVDDKKTGLLIEPDNLSQLEEAINTAICDRSLLQYFSINTFEKVRSYFDMCKFTHNMQTIYYQALRK